jgi:hypothetical protein
MWSAVVFDLVSQVRLSQPIQAIWTDQTSYVAVFNQRRRCMSDVAHRPLSWLLLIHCTVDILQQLWVEVCGAVVARYGVRGAHRCGDRYLDWLTRRRLPMCVYVCTQYSDCAKVLIIQTVPEAHMATFTECLRYITQDNRYSNTSEPTNLYPRFHCRVQLPVSPVTSCFLL